MSEGFDWFGKDFWLGVAGGVGSTLLAVAAGVFKRTIAFLRSLPRRWRMLKEWVMLRLLASLRRDAGEHLQYQIDGLQLTRSLAGAGQPMRLKFRLTVWNLSGRPAVVRAVKARLQETALPPTVMTSRFVVDVEDRIHEFTVPVLGKQTIPFNEPCSPQAESNVRSAEVKMGPFLAVRASLSWTLTLGSGKDASGDWRELIVEVNPIAP